MRFMLFIMHLIRMAVGYKPVVLLRALGRSRSSKAGTGLQRTQRRNPACDTAIDLDLTVKRRDPDAPIRVALNDVQCPRCNGHGRTRIAGLSRYPSI
jgi:hypothetical protein